MKVTLVQRFHKLYDRDYNTQIIVDEIESTDSDLIVFPELFLTGYFCRDRTVELAAHSDCKWVNQIIKSAKQNNKYVIFGMIERDNKVRAHVYNSAVFIDPKGNLDTYRKLYLVNFGPFEDKRYFTPGNKLPVFETDFGRIAIIICYDIFFPELSKYYALNGADIIVCISASPSFTRIFFEKIMVARAIETTTFFLYANLIGTEKNLVYWGGDTIVGPRGDIIAKGKYYEEARVEAELALEDLVYARENRPTLRDTRFDVFEILHELGKPKSK